MKKPLKSKSSKPFRYWKNFKILEAELKPICVALGKFPSRGDLVNFGRMDIVSAINKHHGGFQKVCAKLGFDLNKRPTGYYKTFAKLKKDLALQITADIISKRFLRVVNRILRTRVNRCDRGNKKDQGETQSLRPRKTAVAGPVRVGHLDAKYLSENWTQSQYHQETDRAGEGRT